MAVEDSKVSRDVLFADEDAPTADGEAAAAKPAQAKAKKKAD
jgi:hypothetical protein